MKQSMLLAMLFLIIASGSAYSPAQIVEVTDNFGNTYDVDSNFGHDGTFARIVNDEQEVIVSDDTEITFCVTEVEHEEGRNLEYYFSHWGSQVDTGWKNDNCATFDGYTQEDWSGNTWSFEIYVRDDSEITARDSDVEGGYDFQFQPRFSNLVLPSNSGKETVTTSYDTIKVSKSSYESFKQDSEELSELENKFVSKNKTIEELRGNLDQKESTIQELNEQVENKNSKINEMNSTITALRSKLEDMNGGFLNFLRPLF